MSAQDFGANDWLVDEMYEQYLQNPTSVDPAWVEYFKSNKPGSTAPQSMAAKGVPPIPKAQQKAAVHRNRLAAHGFGHTHGLKSAPAAVAEGEVDGASAFVARAARIRTAFKHIYVVPALGEKGGPKASHEARSDDGGVL